MTRLRIGERARMTQDVVERLLPSDVFQVERGGAPGGHLIVDGYGTAEEASRTGYLRVILVTRNPCSGGWDPVGVAKVLVYASARVRVIDRDV